MNPNLAILLRHPLIELARMRSEEHTSELQSRLHLVCRLLLEKKKLAGKRPRLPASDGLLPSRWLCQDRGCGQRILGADMRGCAPPGSVPYHRARRECHLYACR